MQNKKASTAKPKYAWRRFVGLVKKNTEPAIIKSPSKIVTIALFAVLARIPMPEMRMSAPENTKTAVCPAETVMTSLSRALVKKGTAMQKATVRMDRILIRITKTDGSK